MKEDRDKKESRLKDNYKFPHVCGERNVHRAIREEKRFWKKALHRLQRRNGKIRLDDGSLTSE
jgi:hypothetical protein